MSTLQRQEAAVLRLLRQRRQWTLSDLVTYCKRRKRRGEWRPGDDISIETARVYISRLRKRGIPISGRAVFVLRAEPTKPYGPVAGMILQALRARPDGASIEEIGRDIAERHAVSNELIYVHMSQLRKRKGAVIERIDGVLRLAPRRYTEKAAA